MEIRLTTEDADFILAYLRAQLQSLTMKYDKALDMEKQLNDNYEKVKEFVDPSSLDEMHSMVDEFGELYKVQSDSLIKCIELLTVGSMTNGTK